ncbi:hypothetical protein AUEXF2481DRAFT_568224 [Aureobasidium subglaciale EXF-2481]|uniref:Uncharacterized protein n=1 Tax=Aureobasidium subglaciale (strain EXF-2481) TaxID=1043005 RepID=A0A074Y8D3_AURSE|nr:uncharacterized protein AUEXF2481DRAFT_568224 [Aureobasidium subglaciale EXF-2481]KEQ90477.1 hypothetical protein AUEXF2481DRAFT_568224 [Aureobasidium subglaciale EXF-2481]
MLSIEYCFRTGCVKVKLRHTRTARQVVKEVKVVIHQCDISHSPWVVSETLCDCPPGTGNKRTLYELLSITISVRSPCPRRIGSFQGAAIHEQLTLVKRSHISITRMTHSDDILETSFHRACVFIYAISYLERSYGIYAASAASGNAVLRSVMGGCLPLAGPSLYSTLRLR